MTATTERVETRSDLAWRGRIPLALLLPVGPVAIAVLRFVLPYDTTDSSSEVARQVAAHQTAQNAVVWLGFVAMLTLVPAVLVVAKVARRESPRLAAVGAALLVPGYLALGWLIVTDAAVLFAVRQGLPTDVAAEAYAELHPGVAVAGGIFVIGHVVGSVLLGCALLRGTSVPAWAAIAVLVSQPLHFVAAVIVSSHELDLFAWGLNAVGFAAVSVTMLRMSDKEWVSR
ncbi:DUF4386 family protein [Nocardioides immobilis]|uniref:DUF4386 family protein n=1 Tax=Nocardioides immobilis TaxID=2049295 RepID=A0A417Y0H6_9ACTN|nr:DUF4386 family protein [Nocardioides immobilis]RHW26074.1 DUF4386 family protein [Nocardioides immobilis]